MGFPRIQAREGVNTKNTEEVFLEAEIRALAKGSIGKRSYVGYEPSGVLHLGHMLTANKPADLQEAGMDVVVLLADVHAYLNGKGTFEDIHDTAEQMQRQFVAYGLDETSTEFVLGSEFQFEEEYLLDTHALALDTSLNRAQRAMAEIQGDETATVSHVLYPLMQTLDIEYLDIDLAVGGMDQRKVYALQRDALPAVDYDARPAIHTPILADLTTGIGKMSSTTNLVMSGESITISFADDKETIEETVNKIFFPPERNPTFEDYYDAADYDMSSEEATLENPGLQLFQYHVFPQFDRVDVERPSEYGGDVSYDSFASLADAIESGDLHPADAKTALASYLNDLIEPGRDELA